jgi:hypothetical protein
MKKFSLLLVMCLIVVLAYSQRIEFQINDTTWTNVLNSPPNTHWKNPAIPGIAGDTVVLRYVNANDTVESVIWTDDIGTPLDTAFIYYDTLSSDMQHPNLVYACDSVLGHLTDVIYWTKSMVDSVLITQPQAKSFINDSLTLILSDFNLKITTMQGGISMSTDTIIWYCNGVEVKNSIDTLYSEIFDTVGTFNYSIKMRSIHTNIWVTDTVSFIRWYDSDTTITITVDNPTFIDNTNKEKEIFKIYPNPTNDVIYIYTGDNYQNMSDYTIKIVNTLGQTVFENLIDNQLFSVDVSAFGSTGLYFIQIIDDTSQIIDVRKIILE